MAGVSVMAVLVAVFNYLRTYLTVLAGVRASTDLHYKVGLGSDAHRPTGLLACSSSSTRQEVLLAAALLPSDDARGCCLCACRWWCGCCL